LLTQETRFHHLGKQTTKHSKPEKPGFLCQQINPQQPYFQRKSRHSRFIISERNPVFVVKSRIIMLSDGKTGFQKVFEKSQSILKPLSKPLPHRERGFDYYSPSLVGKGLGVRFLRL
jgi:hypothetical protein